MGMVGHVCSVLQCRNGVGKYLEKVGDLEKRDQICMWCDKSIQQPEVKEWEVLKIIYLFKFRILLRLDLYIHEHLK